MEIKVVTGANYGDEGKGMVAYALAKEAKQQNKNVLSVLYNGGVQRAHTVGDQIVHCTGAGDLAGGATYYDKMFLVDPIALWITGTKVYIHPDCRVVLPCDVMRNREKEIARGDAKHGSCGMGIFECCKRSNTQSSLFVKDFYDQFALYQKIKQIESKYPYSLNDELYTIDNFMRAVGYVLANCTIGYLDNFTSKFDVMIYEGGQGLLLDQQNMGDFPHLTPSSVGSYNIYNEINGSGANSVDVFYVSRSYMTRHGAGPMEEECAKAAINADIVDKTNMPNDWQGALRFGFLKTDSLYRRVYNDFKRYDKANLNMVFTQLNYTDGKLATGAGVFEEIVKPSFVDTLYLSDQKDIIERV